MDTILALLDRLEAILTRGGHVPLTDKKVIDEREALGILRMIRAQLPQELHRAQRLRQEAEELHRRAADEARRIVLEAERHARRLVEESAVLAEAEQARAHLLAEAEAEAARIRTGADAYAAGVLADLEEQVLRILGTIQRGRAALRRSE
ncbi:MAG: hypothetical protein QN122_11245 [Armatimonadota bacterium]|nr:hypothetical protein [Armatimonadota bacterium]MDR7447616.1 hypothetical protein [Armatimonadota bacterium]MDR7459503.1 hypothetical protein [Armatimonadota bacterium]MDR7480481.1 hypothetical protein [Armatimonadota bacterium]MDR7489813.1 hypothetical protein [Armatimonadota bacterium]